MLCFFTSLPLAAEFHTGCLAWPQVHREFLDAGADIVSTVSYQATVPGFQAAGLAATDEEAQCLVRAGVDAAKTAIACHKLRCAAVGETNVSLTTKTMDASETPVDRPDADRGSAHSQSDSCRASSDDIVADVSPSASDHSEWPARSLRHPLLQSEPGTVILAVSVGPYGAYLADGSEYTGSYSLPNDELAGFHLATLRAHLGSGAGVQIPGCVFAFETVPLRREAVVIAMLMRDYYPRVPFWISFQAAPGGKTAAGEPLDEVASDLARICYSSKTDVGSPAAALVGIGVNCCSPSTAVDGVRALVSAVPPWCEVLCYPNSGEVWDGAGKQWLPCTGMSADENISVSTALHAAVASVAAGATIVGGCCRVGPNQIAEIKRTLSP